MSTTKLTDRELRPNDWFWIMFIIVIILSLFLFSCKHEELKPSFTSLEGKWQFERTAMKGNFTTQMIGNQLVVTSGVYELRDRNLNWHSYPIVKQTNIVSPIKEVRLQETDINYFLIIEVDSIYKDYTGFRGKTIYSSSLRNDYLADFRVPITRLP